MFRIRFALLVLVGCAAPAHATEAPMFREQEIQKCDALTDKKQWKLADACITKLDASGSDKEKRALFYSRLTWLIAQEKLADAQTLADETIARVKPLPDPWECWLYNAANWVAWARGDLAAAVKYTEGMKDSSARHQMSRPEGRALALHYYWDRAYLQRELARSLPAGADRDAAMVQAEASRASYRKIADPEMEADGLAVLDAFFLVREGKGKEAKAAIAKVDRTAKGDLQDQYIVALALEAGGDRVGAEAVRKIIRTSKNIYPMKALIVRQIARDKSPPKHDKPAP